MNFIYEEVKTILIKKRLKKSVKSKLLLACEKYAIDNELYEDLKLFGDMKK